MKPLILALIMAPILTLSTTALAQQDWNMPKADTAPQDEPSPFERGAETIFRDLFDRFGPALDDLSRELDLTAKDYAPVMRDLGRMIDDIRNYEMPERLENGDVIIRRRKDAPPPPDLALPPPDDTTRPEIDL